MITNNVSIYDYKNENSNNEINIYEFSLYVSVTKSSPKLLVLP